MAKQFQADMQAGAEEYAAQIRERQASARVKTVEREQRTQNNASAFASFIGDALDAQPAPNESTADTLATDFSTFIRTQH